MKINSNNWKEFQLTKIFRMKNTKSIVQKDIVPDSGETPYVTAQGGNNGVMTYVSVPGEWLEEGNCIMIGGKTMTFSYQPKAFCSNDSHNIALYAKDERAKTELCYLYLIVALRAMMESRYSWGDSISMTRIKKETMLLPVNVQNDPDWKYMEEYMMSVMEDSKKSLATLRRADKSKKNIEISQWKRFHLYDDDLFDIDMGTKLDRSKMTEVTPTVNFVGRANANNGITTKVDMLPDVKPYDAGNLTVSLGGEYLGSCFIQPEEFYTSQNVIVLIPKWNMPFLVKMFISTMIFRESRTYYKAFVDELNRHVKKDFSFYLPVDKYGKPDWVYMSEQMENYLETSMKNIEAIQSV